MPQKPAEGILEIKSLSNSYRQYYVQCKCGDPNHAHTIFVEIEDEDVIVNTYTTETIYWWDYQKTPTHVYNEFVTDIIHKFRQAYSSLLLRIKYTKDIWINGNIEYKSDIIMTKQQALNYADVLKNAVDDIDCEYAKSSK